MSTSNKRFFDDDLFRPSFTCSPSSIKKRLCISLVPTVPRGGANYLSDINSSPNNLLLSLNGTTLNAGDRIMDKI
jgi:hypothetical protein